MLRLNDPNGSVKMLVVMDQVENAIGRSDWQWYESFLSQWAEDGRRSAVLVTSRSSILSTSTIALTGLNEAEGIAFFDRKGITGIGRSELITLASGHPLLLKLAAAWAKETYGARVDDIHLDRSWGLKFKSSHSSIYNNLLNFSCISASPLENRN